MGHPQEYSDVQLEKGLWQPSKPEPKHSLHSSPLHWLLCRLQSAKTPKSSTSSRLKLSRTAYLDGLRGFAAFLVYWQHHELWVRETSGDNAILENGFGYKGKYHFATLPGIRLLFSGGHFAVPVFFVISGYVLSAKPLSLVQSGEYAKLQENVASALFRRWLRLWLPVAATTFIYMCLAHYPGFYTDDYFHKATFREELWEWYTQIKNFSYLFDGSGNPFFPYNGHIWTIPIEFRGSVAIYISAMAFSRFSRNARLLGEVALIYYFLYISDGSYYAMFMAGQLLCDLDLLAMKNELPRFLATLEPYKTIIYYHLLVFGIYLGGVPAHTQDLNVLKKTRGWYYLSLLKPQAVFDYKWFFLFWGALFLVSAIPRIVPLKQFFESRFCQYLGRISFGLYLVHGPILFILGDRLYSAAGWVRIRHVKGIPGWPNAFPLSHAGPLGLEWGFLLPNLVLLPVTLWVAELATRWIDGPSVRVTQALFRRLQGSSSTVKQ